VTTDPISGGRAPALRMKAGERAIAHQLTVIVPTTGGPVLRGCLESIAAGTLWPARLIVIDQGRRAENAECLGALRARGMDAVHVPLEEMGISAATNRGLERVETLYAAVTHDDCRVRSDWLQRLSARLPEVNEAILTGRVEAEGEGVVLTVKTDPQAAVYTTPLLRGDVLFPPNMAFPIRVVNRVGPFDEHPSLRTAGEDNDWAHRALRSGIPIIYDPSVVVGHLARHRREEVPALYRRYARGQGAFYGKWLRRGDLFIARRVIRDLVRAPWLLLRGLVTRNPDLIAMGQGEVTGLLPGIFAGLGNRPARR
jgi:GT2 family glycosyltransferase